MSLIEMIVASSIGSMVALGVSYGMFQVSKIQRRIIVQSEIEQVRANIRRGLGCGETMTARPAICDTAAQQVTLMQIAAKPISTSLLFPVPTSLETANITCTPHAWHPTASKST